MSYFVSDKQISYLPKPNTFSNWYLTIADIMQRAQDSASPKPRVEF